MKAQVKFSITPLCALLCGLFVQTVNGHVALTFPPARQYDLDFLDNGRTQAPCGMPKGKQIFVINTQKSVNIVSCD